MPSALSPARRRARLLAELPTVDPRLLGRHEGRVALVALEGATLSLSVAARQLPGLALPTGEAAAASEALEGLREVGAEPLALLQCHRWGEAEAPGMEGRLRALRTSALRPGPLCVGGTVQTHSAWDALLQTHAFALGLGGRRPEVEEVEDEAPLPDGVAMATSIPPPPEALHDSAVEPALRRCIGAPALADLAPVCGAAPEGRAALIPVPGSHLALAFACADAVEVQGEDPFWAAAEALAAAARKVACVGARPAAAAVAWSLGPADPAQRWALRQGLAGLRQAALALELPILALEAAPCPEEVREAPIARPAVAVFGVIEDHAGAVDVSAPDATGLTAPGQRSCGGAWRGPLEGLFVLGDAAQELRLDEELSLQRTLREGIGLGLIRSARDLGIGGLLGAAAEAACASGQGAQMLLARGEAGLEALLFGASPGRALVSVPVAGESALRTLCDTHRLALTKVGVTGGTRLAVAVDGLPIMDADVAELAAIRTGALEPWLG